MDSGLLGLGRQRVHVESRVLGSACRLLRRCQLWIRLHRIGLSKADIGSNGAFFYNRSVNNITNVTNITNVYNKTVINNLDG